MGIEKTNNDPIPRKGNFEAEQLPPLTDQQLRALHKGMNFLDDLGIAHAGREGRRFERMGPEKDSPPRVFCLKPNAQGVEEMKPIALNSMKAAEFWKETRAGNVFVYAAGEREPRQLQMNQESMTLSVSKPLRPNEIPATTPPPNPNRFKRFFSFLNKKWKKQATEYDNFTRNQETSRQAREERLNKISAIRTDKKLKAELESVKEKKNIREIESSYKALSQRESGVKLMTSVYQPVPEFDEDGVRIVEGDKKLEGLYSREQFNDLKVYSKDEFDLDSISVGGQKVTNEDFASVTLSALWRPEFLPDAPGWDFHTEKSLQEAGKMSKEEATKLIGASQGASFWTTDLFINPPRDKEGSYFKKTTNRGRQMAVDAFNDYKAGKKDKLAELLAGGIDKGIVRLKDTSKEGYLNADELCVCTMTPKMTALLDRDPDLKKIAQEKYGLTQEKLDCVKGMETLAQFDQERREATYRLDRENKIGDQHLTKEDKEKCAKAMVKVKIAKEMLKENIEQPLNNKRLQEIEANLNNPNNWQMPGKDDMKYQNHPELRPAPEKGKINFVTAMTYKENLVRAFGKEPKTLSDLSKKKFQNSMERISEEIVKNHNLGEKSAGELAKELAPNAFREIDVLKESKSIAEEIAGIPKPAKDEKAIEQEKTKTMEDVSIKKRPSLDKINKAPDRAMSF